MPITTVLATKDEAPIAYAPLLLARIQFIDGSYLYLSTAPLNTTEGGFAYAGQDWLARIDSQDIAQIAARSEQGVDRIPSVTLHIHDSDKLISSNYEFAAGKGFKGSLLTLLLVFWSADTSSFTSDSWVPFVGICEGPQLERSRRGDLLIVNATASHNLAKSQLPVFRLQQRCGNVFPRNADERLSGATDPSHKCWGCGYNPDQNGTDPEIGGDCRRGNMGSANQSLADGTVVTDSGGRYVFCDYTADACKLRGMYKKDSADRRTGRFTGATWQPSDREILSKSYVEGKTIPVLQMRNDAAYQESIPMLYGTQWVNAPVTLSVPADGNSTRGETVVCQDDIGEGGIVQVVVNGVILPQNGSSPDNNLFRWNFLGGEALHTGTRNGVPTGDAPWNGEGDPHGSQATIEWVVYSQLAQAGSVPNIRVLAMGPKIQQYYAIASYNNGVVTFTGANVSCAGNPPYRITISGCSLSAANGSWELTNWTYGPPGTITLSGGPSGSGSGGYVQFKARSSNAVSVLLDVLIWSNYRYMELDLNTFIRESAYCDPAVSYTDLTGKTSTHARFKAQFCLEGNQRRSADAVVKALLKCFNAQLTRNPQTGLLQCFIRKTLADQQPAAIPGSNYNTPVSSVTAAGAVSSGYVAYSFDESNIARQGPDDPPFLKFWIDATANAPNKVYFGFQDEDNSFSQDSISVVDVEGVNRAGGYLSGEQEIVEQLDVLGISNFDQGTRIANCYLAEKLRGNPQGDTRGTIFVELPTNFRVLHLQVGHLIFVSWQAYGWVRQLFRVTSISPTTNWEGCTIRASWHLDEWYTDVFGQRGPQTLTDPRLAKPNRTPYPWMPYGEQPITGDSFYGSPAGYNARSWWGMRVSQTYQRFQDGSAISLIPVHGCPPVNRVSKVTYPPLMGILGTALGTGGTIPGAREIFIAIAALDADGYQTMLSAPTKCVTPAGTDTCSITTPAISWFAGTNGYVVYAGTTSAQLSQQTQGYGTPSTLTLTSLNFATFGPPDQLADSLHFLAKRCGGAGDAAGDSFGHGGIWGDILRAVSENTLTFAPPYGRFSANQFAGYDLMLVALPAGDAGAIRIATFHVTANDADGNITVTPDPLAAGIAVGSVFVCLSKPGEGTIATKIVDPNWNNPYSEVGGLLPDAERGNVVRVLYGSGRFSLRTITTNDATSISWDDPLPVVPDSTTRYVIETPNWDYDLAVDKIDAANSTPDPPPMVAKVPIDNYAGQTIFLTANVRDSDGNDSVGQLGPWRMVYIWGIDSALAATAQITLDAEDSPFTLDGTYATVHCDTSDGPIVVNIVPSAQLPLGKYVIDKTTSDSNTVDIRPATGETINYQGSMQLTTRTDGSNGFIEFTQGG